MPLVEAKCTSCGASLKIDNTNKTAICQFCGNSFVVEQAINNINISNIFNASNITIIQNDCSSAFEIESGELKKYKGTEVDVVIPETVTSIGEGAFRGVAITSVTFPTNLMSINTSAFERCSSLESVNFSKVKSGFVIGEKAFQDCSSLVSLSIDTIDSIAAYAFQGCWKLDNIIINELHGIGDYAFRYCNSLSTLNLSNTDCVHIGKGAFSHCSNLKSIELPEGIKVISQNLFENCESLKSIVIPKNVSYIDFEAFSNCPKLTDIIFQNKSTEYRFSSFDKSSNICIHYNDGTTKNISSTNDSTGGCYIATCIYGDYDCPQVWTLRRFRDNTLSKSWYGRTFISFYYSVSPKIVRRFGKQKLFHKMFKKPLDSLVHHLNNKGVRDTPYCDK